jgi:hypothetical protein
VTSHNMMLCCSGTGLEGGNQLIWTNEEEASLLTPEEREVAFRYRRFCLRIKGTFSG